MATIVVSTALTVFRCTQLEATKIELQDSAVGYGFLTGDISRPGKESVCARLRTCRSVMGSKIAIWSAVTVLICFGKLLADMESVQWHEYESHNLGYLEIEDDVDKDDKVINLDTIF